MQNQAYPKKQTNNLFKLVLGSNKGNNKTQLKGQIRTYNKKIKNYEIGTGRDRIIYEKHYDYFLYSLRQRDKTLSQTQLEVDTKQKKKKEVIQQLVKRRKDGDNPKSSILVKKRRKIRDKKLYNVVVEINDIITSIYKELQKANSPTIHATFKKELAEYVKDVTRSRHGFEPINKETIATIT